MHSSERPSYIYMKKPLGATNPVTVHHTVIFSMLLKHKNWLYYALAISISLVLKCSECGSILRRSRRDWTPQSYTYYANKGTPQSYTYYANKGDMAYDSLPHVLVPGGRRTTELPCPCPRATIMLCSRYAHAMLMLISTSVTLKISCWRFHV